jgi:serine phosphatase RsbU (regulator of sigma subunit)
VSRPTEIPRRRRADAEVNAERVLLAAVELLRSEPDASIEDVADAAGVSRATVYRHFRSRVELVEAARERSLQSTDANEQDALRPAGELAGGPTPFDVADVLNKVPPHLLGEQIVAEAQRLTGVSSVALYLVDIDGTRLWRLAGAPDFPESLEAPLAVGPEISRESVELLRRVLAEELPGTVMAPLLLRGRALGLLLAVGAGEAPLVALARQAAASLALAGDYTDVFDQTRRRKETSAAAEIQQNLLPPRIARVAGGVLAGNVLPSYEIGGDWFDYIENRDGVWLGIADSTGTGTTAASLSAIALGAFRAKRKFTAEIADVAAAIHATLLELDIEGAFVNVVLARWHAPSSRLSWLTCGDQPPLLISHDGTLEQLSDPDHEGLGLGGAHREFTVTHRRLEPGERLLLLSDGVLERRRRGGGTIGVDGIRAAVSRARDLGAASAVRAIEDAIHDASSDQLEDDATVVVFAPSTRV